MSNRCLFPHRLLALLIVLLSANAFAAVHAAGTFQAVRACDAFKSFQKGTNPGNIRLEPGQSYPIEELNEREGEWIRISMPGLRDSLRWVPRECGVTEFMRPEPPATTASGRPQR